MRDESISEPIWFHVPTHNNFESIRFHQPQKRSERITCHRFDQSGFINPMVFLQNNAVFLEESLTFPNLLDPASMTIVTKNFVLQHQKYLI